MYFLCQKPMIFLFQIMFIIPFVPICCQSILPKSLLSVIAFLLLFSRFFHLLLLQTPLLLLKIVMQKPGPFELLGHSRTALGNIKMFFAVAEMNPHAG